MAATGEDSAATGIGGDETDNAGENAGAVYVFTRSDNGWIQQAYIKASNAESADELGVSVALSANGSTLAVGASNEDSSATAVDGSAEDNSAADAGAVYVFARVDGVWTQQAYVKASNTDAGDRFGQTVALSDDGSTLAVGAYLEASSASGLDGDQGDNSALGAGAVYVFARNGTTWTQHAYLKPSNPDADDMFSSQRGLALSGDGSTLAVGAYYEASAATGIASDQANNSAPGAGAVYVFTRAGSMWRQQSYLKASNTDGGDFFGDSVALSSDGSTLAVGAIGEKSSATGINGNQADNSRDLAGAVYVFARAQETWTQQAYVKATLANDTYDEFEWFGDGVSLSADGSTLAAGDRHSVRVFSRDDGAWSEGPKAYLVADAGDGGGHFGIALTADGATLAVGAGHSARGGVHIYEPLVARAARAHVGH